MEYLHVLSRPKVIDQEHDTVWTEAYIDSTVSWYPTMLCSHTHTQWVVGVRRNQSILTDLVHTWYICMFLFK